MNDTPASAIRFWPYDIFGYLLPGVLVLAPLTQFHRGIRAVIEDRYQPDSISDNVVLVILCYVLGHLIAAASSLLLERTALKLTFGYPVVQMFCGYRSGPWPRRILGKLTDAYKHHSVKWMRERRLWNLAYRSIRSCCHVLRRRLDWLPGYVHPYDADFVRAVQKRFVELYGISHGDWSLKRRTHDLIWMVQAYVMHNMPRIDRAAMHFIELYGFSRNACFAFLVAAAYPFCPEWEISLCCSLAFPDWLWTTFCVTAAVAMYVNFAKLIRRHNDLLLRAFVAIDISPAVTDESA